MRTAAWLVLMSAFGVGAAAQETEPNPSVIEARIAEHGDDFDYLLGDWRFTATDPEYGTYGGYWSAVRLAEGQILDEYRITGDEGETYVVITTIRSYNAVRDRWELIGMGAGGGLQDLGTAHLVGGEMHLEQRFGVAYGRPQIWRIRYHDIEADRFSWVADRSLDDGATWQTGYMTIEARRIGPARRLEPLTRAVQTVAGS